MLTVDTDPHATCIQITRSVRLLELKVACEKPHHHTRQSPFRLQTPLTQPDIMILLGKEAVLILLIFSVVSLQIEIKIHHVSKSKVD